MTTERSRAELRRRARVLDGQAEKAEPTLARLLRKRARRMRAEARRVGR